MTTSTTIRHRLESARDELARTQARVADLERQLIEAQTMESAEARRREHMRTVMARLRQGQWVAGDGGRMWWHKDGQVCIDRATADELDALDSLATAGVVESGTKRVAA